MIAATIRSRASPHRRPDSMLRIALRAVGVSCEYSTVRYRLSAPLDNLHDTFWHGMTVCRVDRVDHQLEIRLLDYFDLKKRQAGNDLPEGRIVPRGIRIQQHDDIDIVRFIRVVDKAAIDRYSMNFACRARSISQRSDCICTRRNSESR